MGRKREILLFSGGMDSYMAWRLLDHPPCLYVKLGHRYQESELNTCRVLEAWSQDRLEVQVCDLGAHFGGLEQPDGHIPYRNLVLATVAATFADVVYLGAVRGEASRDKSARFLEHAAEDLGWLERRRVDVVAPFRHLTKAALVRKYLREFPEASSRWMLRRTRSCYAEDEVACGRCQACFRRWVAFTLNGLEEQYLVDPPAALRDRVREEGKLAQVRRFLETDWREWGNIVVNNLSAARALRRWGRG